MVLLNQKMDLNARIFILSYQELSLFFVGPKLLFVTPPVSVHSVIYLFTTGPKPRKKEEGLVG